MRHQERLRNKVERLADVQNELRIKNEILRAENQSLRNVLKSMKEKYQDAAMINVAHNAQSNAWSTTVGLSPPAPLSNDQNLLSRAVPALQALLHARQQQQQQSQAHWMAESLVPQLQVAILPSIQNSILGASSTGVADPSLSNTYLLQHSLEVLQSYSSGKQQGSYGGAQPGTQSSLPQAHQQLNTARAMGPMPGGAVSISESGNENQEDSGVDEARPSSEKSSEKSEKP